MDVTIIAPNHPNHEKLKTFYESKLKETFARYPFAKAVQAKVIKNESGEYDLSLEVNPGNGKRLFAKASAKSESSALNQSIKRIRRQILKLKEQLYKKR